MQCTTFVEIKHDCTALESTHSMFTEQDRIRIIHLGASSGLVFCKFGLSQAQLGGSPPCSMGNAWAQSAITMAHFHPFAIIIGISTHFFNFTHLGTSTPMQCHYQRLETCKG